MLTLLTLTLLGPLVVSFWGYATGSLTKWLSVAVISVASLQAFYVFYTVFSTNAVYTMDLGTWISAMNLNWSFSIDRLSATMLIPVLLVSTLVQIYACSYMSADPHQPRFFSYLSMFSLLMVVLLLGDNYMVMFIGWEGVGVISYLLISFWTTGISNMKSALSAMLLNRFGDTFFVLALASIYTSYNSFDFSVVNSTAHLMNTNVNTFICLCLLIAAAAKSAQFGLHGWLLNAMAGPTPVSSLLHAATMVTAGCFVLIKNSTLLEFTPSVLVIILYLGGLTTITAGLVAVFSNDIKRIIALSTMSQLGMIVMAIGASSYNFALYHLFCHSFFKALLFMSAGAVIHAVKSEYQDMRTYGGFNQYLPYTYTCLLIASLSLMALPSMTGYSKDFIIESMLGSSTSNSYGFYMVAVGSALMTTIYSMKILHQTFWNKPMNNKLIYSSLHETDTIMLIPMTILAIMSIFAGYFFKDLLVGMGTEINFQLPQSYNLVETEFTLSSLAKTLPLILAITGSIVTVYVYEYVPTNYKSNIYRTVSNFFNQRVMYDQILNNLIIRSSLRLGWSIHKNLDQGLLSILGKNGMSWISIRLSKLFRDLLLSRFYSLSLMMFILITLTLTTMMYPSMTSSLIMLFILITILYV